MKDSDVLKYLQSMLGDLEAISKRYRANRKVAATLQQVYSSVAVAGGAIIDKMAEDERTAAVEAAAEARKKILEEQKERKERRDAKKSK